MTTVSAARKLIGHIAPVLFMLPSTAPNMFPESFRNLAAEKSGNYIDHLQIAAAEDERKNLMRNSNPKPQGSPPGANGNLDLYA